jgi:hypothetical protein
VLLPERNRLVPTILLYVANATVAFAQVGYLWTPEELAAKADLIAIVEVISTRDTGRTQSHPSLQPPLPVVEMESELRVLALLKAPVGGEKPDTLRLMYFRHDKEQWQRENPSPPGTPSRGLVNAGSTLQIPPSSTRYLAFLARMSDGRYQPLSGQTFPTASLLRLCESDQRPC